MCNVFLLGRINYVLKRWHQNLKRIVTNNGLCQRTTSPYGTRFQTSCGLSNVKVIVQSYVVCWNVVFASDKVVDAYSWAMCWKFGITTLVDRRNGRTDKIFRIISEDGTAGQCWTETVRCVAVKSCNFVDACRLCTGMLAIKRILYMP